MPDFTPDVVTQGSVNYSETPIQYTGADIASRGSDTGTSGISQDQGQYRPYDPLPQQQQQPQGREAYFQSRYDKLANYFNQNGVQLAPDIEDYGQVFSPYFESHKILQNLDQNPHLILEAARQLFPKMIVQEDTTSRIRDALIQEFGEDYTPDYQESLIVGSPSWQYVQRMNQISMDLKMQEMQSQWDEQRKVVEQQEAIRQDFDTQVTQLTATSGIDREQTLSYLNNLATPQAWSIKNLVTFARLLNNEFDLVPKGNNQQQQQPYAPQMPPSIGSMNGGFPVNKDNGFGEFLGFNQDNFL